MGRSFPSTCIAAGLVKLRVMISVLVWLILSPTWLAKLLRSSLANGDGYVIVKQDRQQSQDPLMFHLIPLGPSSVVFLITQSMTILKRRADITHPCLTPLFTSNQMLLCPTKQVKLFCRNFL